MSTTFHTWCDTCGIAGPRIQRSAGGVALWDNGPDDNTWSRWLLDHENCDQRIVAEGAINRVVLEWLRAHGTGEERARWSNR